MIPPIWRRWAMICLVLITAEDVVDVDGILCMKIVTEKMTNRGTKTQSESKRIVPVHSKLAPFLDRVMTERGQGNATDLLFRYAGNRHVKSANFIRYGVLWANNYNDHAKKVWPEMHVHCWRSYAVSQMAAAGIPEEVRRRVVGHAVIGVHDGYTHVDVKRLSAAVESIH